MIKPHLPDHLNLFSVQQHVQYNLSALVSPFPLAHCGHSSQWFPSSTLQTLWDAAAVPMLLPGGCFCDSSPIPLGSSSRSISISFHSVSSMASSTSCLPAPSSTQKTSQIHHIFGTTAWCVCESFVPSQPFVLPSTPREHLYSNPTRHCTTRGVGKGGSRRCVFVCVIRIPRSQIRFSGSLTLAHRSSIARALIYVRGLFLARSFIHCAFTCPIEWSLSDHSSRAGPHYPQSMPNDTNNEEEAPGDRPSHQPGG